MDEHVAARRRLIESGTPVDVGFREREEPPDWNEVFRHLEEAGLIGKGSE